MEATYPYRDMMEVVTQHDLSSRKRKREDDETVNKVSRLRPNDVSEERMDLDTEPSSAEEPSSKKRPREDDDGCRKVSRLKVEYDLFGLKRKREPEYGSNKRLKTDNPPLPGYDDFGEMNIRFSYQKRVLNIMMLLQGTVDALHARHLDEHRIERMQVVVEDICDMQKAGRISPQNLREITEVLIYLCKKSQDVMNCIQVQVVFLANSQ